MRHLRTRKIAGVTAGAAALALVLAACGDGNGGETDAGGSDNGNGVATVENGDEAPISIAIPSGWDEGIAVSNLWGAVLEDQGYDVEMETLDIGPLFTALAGGGHDVMFDAWLPITHEGYIETYGDDLEELGTWYDGAVLTVAVNEDSSVQSLEDLAANADVYGNRLVGIEAGAGLTQAVEDEVIPTYGLEGMEFVVSSTPAMLAELQAATGSGDDIAVTLWRPHWAYDEFPIRDLEDPEGTLGADEQVHIFGTGGFGERFPTASDWISDFAMTDEELFSLQNMMFNSDEYANEADATRAWMDENPEFVEAMTQG